MNEKEPPLQDRINQVLTECRVVIPGTQALLGFQLIAFLMDAFARLPAGLKLLHVTSLACVLASVALLMLPAAFHRIGEGGRNTECLLRVSNASLTTAMAILAAGLALDFLVVAYRISSNGVFATATAAATFIFLLVLWYAVPLARRPKPSSPS